VTPPSAGNALVRGVAGEVFFSGTLSDQVDLGAGILKP
jgi:hypothetical protein